MASKTASEGSDGDSKQDKADRTTILLYGGLGVLFIIFAIVIAATDAIFLIPLGILFLVVVGYIGVNRLLAQRIIRRDGSMEEAASDNEDSVPGAHLMPDADTALGDTPEAHDEITPHDLPLFHPGRAEAVADAGGVDGTITGDDDPSKSGPQSTRPVAAQPQSGSSSKRRRAHE